MGVSLGLPHSRQEAQTLLLAKVDWRFWMVLFALIVSVRHILWQTFRRPRQEERVAARVASAESERNAVLEVLELLSAPLGSVAQLADLRVDDPDAKSAPSFRDAVIHRWRN